MRRSTPTPTVTAPQEWARLEACRICLALPGRPCVNLNAKAGGAVRHRPHPERLVVVDRDGAGVMILAEAADVIPARPGASRWRGAVHAVAGGKTVCGSRPVNPAAVRPLAAVERGQRCRRPSCRRVMWEEEQR